jgi:uncharacterized protein (DUF983 family)
MLPRTLNQQAFTPRCPACGKGKLFTGMLTPVPSCTACGHDLNRYNAGDGPAFFAITLMGFLVTGGAVWVEIAYKPPMWLHAALWIPFTLIGCISVLRAFKAILITLEYRLLHEKETPDDTAR